MVFPSHITKGVVITTIENCNASSGHSVPRRIEMPCFEGIESRLNAVEICISMLASDTVKAGLQCQVVALLFVESHLHESRGLGSTAGNGWKQCHQD